MDDTKSSLHSRQSRVYSLFCMVWQCQPFLLKQFTHTLSRLNTNKDTDQLEKCENN